MLPDTPCIPPLFGGCRDATASSSPFVQSAAAVSVSEASSGAVAASGSMTVSPLAAGLIPPSDIAVTDHHAASVGAKPCPTEYKTADYKTGDYKIDGYKTTGYKPVPGYKPCPVTYVPRTGAAVEYFLGAGKPDFVMIPGGRSSMASIFPLVLWLSLFSLVCIGLLLKVGFAQKIGKNRVF